MKLGIFTLLIFLSSWTKAAEIPSSPRATKAIHSVQGRLIEALAKKGLHYGSPIFIRIFKNSSELELWVLHQDTYVLFKTYDICRFSGRLGPKTKVGDYQAPEGFYFFGPQSLNPWSRYYLSFNLGYPNAYDRAHNYTGSALMIHGKCVSIGCFAMTDKNIAEIYALAHEAFVKGQPFIRVHIFPFHMEEQQLNSYRKHKWISFWQNLSEGYRYFEQHHIPPNVTVKQGIYQFGK